MVKKSWDNPEILDLSIDKTEKGGTMTQNVDATYTDGKTTWWSFS